MRLSLAKNSNLICAGLTLALMLPAFSHDALAQQKSRTKGAPSGAPTDNRAEEIDDTIETLDVGTQDVLERLKLLRVQMALDREEIASLELRIMKINLQRDFEMALVGPVAPRSDDDVKSGAPPPIRAPRRAASDPTTDIIVKSISIVGSQKEAIIMYRGRIFSVRPGDKVGDLEVKDITESGLRVTRSGKQAVVR